MEMFYSNEAAPALVKHNHFPRRKKTKCSLFKSTASFYQQQLSPVLDRVGVLCLLRREVKALNTGSKYRKLVQL